MIETNLEIFLFRELAPLIKLIYMFHSWYSEIHVVFFFQIWWESITKTVYTTAFGGRFFLLLLCSLHISTILLRYLDLNKKFQVKWKQF